MLDYNSTTCKIDRLISSLQRGTEVWSGQNISGYCKPPNWPTQFFANFDQIFQKLSSESSMCVCGHFRWYIGFQQFGAIWWTQL